MGLSGDWVSVNSGDHCRRDHQAPCDLDGGCGFTKCRAGGHDVIDQHDTLSLKGAAGKEAGLKVMGPSFATKFGLPFGSPGFGQPLPGDFQVPGPGQRLSDHDRLIKAPMSKPRRRKRNGHKDRVLTHPWFWEISKQVAQNAGSRPLTTEFR